MDTKERLAFWNVLTSLEGKNIQADTERLQKVLKYPKHIYRFRPVTNNSLEGLRTNKLYFSSADYYDDPFDSYSHIDWNRVHDEISTAFSNEQDMTSAFKMVSLMSGAPVQIIKTFFESKSSAEWHTYGDDLIAECRKFIQANELSICFTEEEMNEVLWLKYAENHHGFVMEYDTTDDNAFLCGKSENCNSCCMSNMTFPLYPIVYSGEKYDATDYVKAVLQYSALNLLPPEIKIIAQQNFPNMTWKRECLGLIKKECHKYDKEWRIIYPNAFDMRNVKNRPFISWRPSSITIGLKTGLSERNTIITLAKEAGIQFIYQCYINKNDELDKKLVGT